MQPTKKNTALPIEGVIANKFRIKIKNYTLSVICSFYYQCDMPYYALTSINGISLSKHHG